MLGSGIPRSRPLAPGPHVRTYKWYARLQRPSVPRTGVLRWVGAACRYSLTRIVRPYRWLRVSRTVAYLSELGPRGTRNENPVTTFVVAKAPTNPHRGERRPI